MILSYKNKFVLLNPPKTGSGFRETVFKDHCDISVITHDISRHLNAKQACRYVQVRRKDPLDYYFCCFVRNPWKRFASWWNMNVNHLLRDGQIKTPEECLTKDMFFEFIKKIKMPQSAWFNLNGEMIDFVGSLENMEGDLYFLSKKLKLDLNLHENVKEYKDFHPQISELWTQEAIDHVAEKDKEVILLKNYDFKP